MSKLHLGCGKKKIHDFINVDINHDCYPDIIDDISILSKFSDNSIDLIYCCHALEHFSKSKTDIALRNWIRVLKPNGEIYISVPDIEMVCRHYILNRDLFLIKGFLWGGQKNEFDFHYNGWDFNTLSNVLYAVGFRDIQRYDWRETDWCYIDDYSQAYLPHLDKTHGVLMSLNIKGKK